MLRRYSQVFRTIFAVADLTAISLAFAVAYLVRFRLDVLPAPPGRPDGEHYVVLWLVSLPVYHILLRSQQGYEPRRGASRLRECALLINVSALATLCLATFAFFLRDLQISRTVLVCSFAFSSVALLAFRGALRGGLAAARRRGFNTRSVLIAGTGPLAEAVYQRLRTHPEAGFAIRGFVGPVRPGPRTALPPILGPYEATRQLVCERSIDQVFLALDRSDPFDPLKLVEALHDTTASVRIAPDLTGLRTIQASGEDLDGLPILCLVESPIVGWPSVLKRAFDLAVASAALVVLSPLLLAIAAAIRLTSPGGPVLYKQRRVSLDAREFTMIKFRTMVPGAERDTGPIWAKRGDPRCTRLGAFLRRTSLDELPQLWNVLQGHMSLVGPRPERPELIAGFRARIPGYMMRHKMKGGLTGLAQVHGCRGNGALEERLAYDIRYASEWSFLLDLKILGLTALRVFRDPSAY